jgi:hypothetical protein
MFPRSRNRYYQLGTLKILKSRKTKVFLMSVRIFLVYRPNKLLRLVAFGRYLPDSAQKC